MSDKLPAVFAFLKQLRDSKAVATLTGSECAYLLTFMSYADRDGVAYPGHETMAEILGVTVRSAERARESLKRKKFLVRVQDGGGRGQIAHWQLAIPEQVGQEQTPAQYVVVSEKTGAQCAPLYDANPGAARRETPAQRDDKPRRHVAKPLTPHQRELLTTLAKPQTSILPLTDNPATVVWRAALASIRRERQALLDAAGEATVKP